MAVRQALLDHFEQARAALLQELGRRLHQALRVQQLPEITAVLYTALSRDGFWTILGQVQEQIDSAALDTLSRWVASWLAQARHRARQASPCPDAIDFKAAGIDVAEYLAMTDHGRYLGVDTGAP